MEICNKFHPEVCYESANICPVCEAFAERDAALAEAEETNDRLSARIVELLDERDAYRSELRL